MRAFESLCPWLSDAFASLEAAALGGRLGHGWLISGPRDIGKRNLVYVLAERLLNHELGQARPHAATPLDISARYTRLAEARDLHPDLHRIRAEEDKQSISVEQVREMTGALVLTPHVAGLKVVIVEKAESMTIGAANALLKSLEEPTPNTYLFLLSERPGRLEATIRSRCQRLTLKVPASEITLAWLQTADLNGRDLPPALLSRGPLAAARALEAPDSMSEYNRLYSDINALYQGKADPHVMAEAWDKGDPDLALTCLIESLQATIRQRLVSERRTPVTDSKVQLTDNSSSTIPTETLFEGLEMAENLREQLGRGINLALALKALLLGLEPLELSRVKP